MEIIEFPVGSGRCICWCLPNRGWDDFSRTLDDYLAQCFRSIAAAYPDKPVAWVVLNYWPDSGRLIVFPSDLGAFGDRNERVCFQLCSDHLEMEFDRTCELADEQAELEWDELEKKMWNCVDECLKSGNAQHVLSFTRFSHPMRLAAFDYDPGEGLFQLPHFDPVATAEMNRQFEDFKRRYGIGG